MKNKTLTYISVAIMIISTIIIYLANNQSKKIVFRCSHTLIIDMKKNSEIVKFKTNTKYTYYNNSTAIKSDVGTMSINESTYVIYRNYISNYYLDGKTINYTVKDVNKTSKDTAPKNESLLQANKDIIHHITISKIHGNVYLIKAQEFPIAVCT
ncbi:hypothetical protein BV901_10355 [Serratia nematodiphila]|nr:hypothetical protein BV901_10355 [Serratia nematodiphila]